MKIWPLFFCLVSASAFASIRFEDKALTMVPKGQIFQNNFREVVVRTTTGTKIKLEFDRNGTLQEASGLNLNRGDEFEPGIGLITLSTAAHKVVKSGHKVRGDWNLEKDFQWGWVYELIEEEHDRKIFHIVNAKTGKLLKSINVPIQTQIDLPTSKPQGQQESKP